MSDDARLTSLAARLDAIEHKLEILIDGLRDPRSCMDHDRDGLPLDERLQQVERDEIARALAVSHGNKRRAAALLQIKRSTLYDRMRRLGMPDGGETAAEG